MVPPDASSETRPVASGFTFKWMLTALIASALFVAGMVLAQANNAPQSPTTDTGSKAASGNQPSSLSNTPRIQAKPAIQSSPPIQKRESIKPRS